MDLGGIVDLIKDLVLMSGLLYLAGELGAPDIRCKDWQAAARASAVWTLVYRVILKLAIVILIVPMALLAAIPVIGWLAVLLISFLVTCGAAGLALWCAGQPFEDFRVGSPEVAVWAGVALASARWALDLVLL